MNIYFCDDKIELAEEYAKIARNYVENHFSQLNIEVFNVQTGRELVVLSKEVETEGGIYFLDIDLNDELMNGINLATEVRKIDPHSRISFISTHEELLVETIKQKVNTLNFIFKDDGIEKLTEEVENTIHEAILQLELELEIFENSKKFKFSFGNQEKEVLIKDIFYFETMAHGSKKVLMRTKNEEIEFVGSMKEVEQRLPDFIRCHKSYLANKENVVRMNRKEKRLYFDDETYCEYSGRKEYEMKKLFG